MKCFRLNVTFLLWLILASITMISCSSDHNKDTDGILSATGERYSEKTLSSKWLIINYWASWCGPCRDEIPELNILFREHPEIFVFGINFDAIKIDYLLKEIQTLDILYPVLIGDVSGLISELERPMVLPTTIIVAPGLHIHKVLTGPQTVSNIIDAMRQG
jgi:thiol-disulfide isomerase/thioredoxin